MTDEDM
jgi:aryl-phospho-beta-D-glucosidase BglC (GH1 family)